MISDASPPTTSSNNSEEYFGVRLTGQVRLAIPLVSVESVLRINPRDICPIPGVSRYWLGVISQKGTLVWVFDFSQLLEVSQAPPTSSSFIVAILKLMGVGAEKDSRRRIRRIACVASELEGIYTLEPGSLTAMPQSLKPTTRELFQGLGQRIMSAEVTQLTQSDRGLDKDLTQTSASSKAERVAILKPEALFQLVQTESVSYKPTLTPALSSTSDISTLNSFTL